MALKDWLKSRGSGEPEKLSVDDLIVLGRFDEAESQLRTKLAITSGDLHARRKLGEVLAGAGRGGEAAKEYLKVADSYAREGFYDKAHALLARAARLIPDQETIQLKMTALERLKGLEHKRDLVIEAVRSAGRGAAGQSAFEMRALWRKLTASPIFDHLPGPQLARLLREMSLESLQPGAELARRGEDRPEAFLVAAGEIQAQVALGEGRRTVLRSFEPGDLVGDRALLEHRPWPADYRAGPASKVLRLEPQGLERAMTGDPDPRRLLDALRLQRHDHDVARTVAGLKESG